MIYASGVYGPGSIPGVAQNHFLKKMFNFCWLLLMERREIINININLSINVFSIASRFSFF